MRVNLTEAVVRKTSCPLGKRRIELYDITTKGLMLEVRPNGGKTFYLRYLDSESRSRQIKIADSRDLTLAQARTQADVFRANLALGYAPRSHKSDLEQKSVRTLQEFFCNKYLPFVKSYKRSWSSDLSIFRNHVPEHIGQIEMGAITQDHILLMIETRRNANAAVGSINRQIILLRYVFNLALKWKEPGVSSNPVSGVVLMLNPETKERFLTLEESKRLYEAVCRSPNPMLKYIVWMLLLTGARKREVLDARWQDFDLTKSIWRIEKTKAGRARHVPLSEAVIELLGDIPRHPSSEFVFANPRTGLAYVTFFTAWNTARSSVGLQDVRVHDLRHSFASFLVNKGRTLYEVQRLLGHSQSKTTQRYAHLSEQTLLEATNVVGNALTGFTASRQS